MWRETEQHATYIPAEMLLCYMWREAELHTHQPRCYCVICGGKLSYIHTSRDVTVLYVAGNWATYTPAEMLLCYMWREAELHTHQPRCYCVICGGKLSYIHTSRDVTVLYVAGSWATYTPAEMLLCYMWRETCYIHTSRDVTVLYVAGSWATYTPAEMLLCYMWREAELHTHQPRCYCVICGGKLSYIHTSRDVTVLYVAGSWATYTPAEMLLCYMWRETELHTHQLRCYCVICGGKLSYIHTRRDVTVLYVAGSWATYTPAEMLLCYMWWETELHTHQPRCYCVICGGKLSYIHTSWDVTVLYVAGSWATYTSDEMLLCYMWREAELHTHQPRCYCVICGGKLSYIHTSRDVTVLYVAGSWATYTPAEMLLCYMWWEAELHTHQPRCYCVICGGKLSYIHTSRDVTVLYVAGSWATYTPAEMLLCYMWREAELHTHQPRCYCVICGGKLSYIHTSRDATVLYVAGSWATYTPAEMLLCYMWREAELHTHQPRCYCVICGGKLSYIHTSRDVTVLYVAGSWATYTPAEMLLCYMWREAELHTHQPRCYCVICGGKLSYIHTSRDVDGGGQIEQSEIIMHDKIIPLFMYIEFIPANYTDYVYS